MLFRFGVPATALAQKPQALSYADPLLPEGTADDHGRHAACFGGPQFLPEAPGCAGVLGDHVPNVQHPQHGLVDLLGERPLHADQAAPLETQFIGYLCRGGQGQHPGVEPGLPVGDGGIGGKLLAAHGEQHTAFGGVKKVHSPLGIVHQDTTDEVPMVLPAQDPQVVHALLGADGLQGLRHLRSVGVGGVDDQLRPRVPDQGGDAVPVLAAADHMDVLCGIDKGLPILRGHADGQLDILPPAPFGDLSALGGARKQQRLNHGRTPGA